jgi:hypothetical protein
MHPGCQREAARAMMGVMRGGRDARKPHHRLAEGHQQCTGAHHARTEECARNRAVEAARHLCAKVAH